jgi:hypothetical protein
MPDPARLLRTINRAAQAFRDTPNRRGRIVFLDHATEALVAGDLHGHLENFRKILDRSALGKHSQRHLIIQEVIHGSFRYPAGGDKSHQLLDLVAALKCQYPQQVHFLLGNHELAQWTNQYIEKADVEANHLFREGIQAAYADHAEAIYAAYLALLAAAPLAVRTANRIFVSHSLPNAKRLDAFDPAVLQKENLSAADVRLGGSVHALLWGRDTREETVTAFLSKVDADLVITGHIPCKEGYEVPNPRQLILDAAGTPACYCLFSTDRPLTQAGLVAGVGTL